MNKFIIYCILFVITNSTTCNIVKSNQETGLYPANGDSIGIPILSTFTLSVIGVAYLTILDFILKYIYSLFNKKIIYFKLLFGLLLITLNFPIIVFLYFGFEYWFIPNHYIISGSYIFSLIILILLLFVEIIKLLFNSTGHNIYA